MGTALQPAVMSEQQVRDLVNRWNGTGFLRIQNLGDKIFIDEIAPRVSYKLQLRSQYEDRSVAQTSVPYTGGPIDEHGQPPDPWDLPLRRPTDFEERTETMALPHTERVRMCAGCAGYGRIDCATCAATGRVQCPACQGKGYREKQEMRTQHEKGGGTTTGMVAVKEPCACHSGEVTCSACGGNGRNTCPTCAGACKTKHFDQVTIAFHAVTASDLLDPTDVPDHLIRAAQGENIVDERAARLDSVPPLQGEVDERVRGLLAKSHAADERKSRLLFQSLKVEQVNIQEVRYRYAGKALRLWVYGDDARVYAPGAPWHWHKLLALIGGIVGAAVLIGIAILALAR